ncbi:uncharacterized protein IL334_003330 [Kwoniella shivajii]|uniref:ubiquitinyl hydrolase 1 n=1 Tax=Kwoniella shivajii TaxID=564305 RepID=A0ABZ1CXK2_9TREE|nr:hypothetical protein IL334_003330 [Kwoniella shivajii]
MRKRRTKNQCKILAQHQTTNASVNSHQKSTSTSSPSSNSGSSSSENTNLDLVLDPSDTHASDYDSSSEDLIPIIRSQPRPWSKSSSLARLVNSSPWPLDQLLRGSLWILHQFYLELSSMAIGLSSWWGGGESSLSTKVELMPLDKEKKVKRRRRKVENDHIYKTDSNNHFPGMVNLSGTLCYMNSVLQAFASITSLVNYLDKILELAVESDTPTPVTDALLDVIQELNTPHPSSPPALRPHNLLIALHPLPQIRRLLSTREQQDAHELFIVLAEAISDEAVKVAGEIAKIRGLGEILSLQKYTNAKRTMGGRADLEGAQKRKKIRGVAQPWEGLMARRRVCQKCGSSGEVRMDLVGGMELAIPLHGDVTLDSCIAEYLSPEYLSDVTCEACSLRFTLSYYKSEVERLSSAPNASTAKPKLEDNPPTALGSFSALDGLSTLSSSSDDKMTNSRRKRARDARRVENRLQEMLDSDSITNFGESFIPPADGSAGTTPIPIKWQTVRTNSIRQSRLTRPPQSLRLLFIRSEFTPYGAVLKKTARVNFPMILDLTRFVSDGIWEENPDLKKMMISNGLTNNHMNGDIPTSQSLSNRKRILYKLESAILHYGYTHSSGHFICLRRKPSPPSIKSGNETGYRPRTINKSCQDGCRCESCLYFGPVRDGIENNQPGKGWLRISDADVEEVGEEALLESRGAVFMLFYEKVGECQGSTSIPLQEGISGSDLRSEGDGNVKLNNASQVI